MTRHVALADVQAIFAAALDDPDAATALMPHLAPVRGGAGGEADGEADSEANAAASAVADGATGATAAGVAPDAATASLRARIGLYRGNVRAARRRALAGAYPVLAALAGDAWFDALAVAYARAHPVRDADLNRFGAALPAFVGQYETDSRHAYFGDVARLEWALHVAAFAANVTPLTPQQWSDAGAERLASARLAVHPACCALASPYAAGAIWRAHQPDAAGAWPARVDAPSWTLVVRPHWRALPLVHTEAAHAAFAAIQRGATLDEALDGAFAVDPAFDFAGQWRVWIECRAITGLRDD